MAHRTGIPSTPAGEPPALPGRPPLHPSGEGAGGEVHRLSALKGAICDALWPTWSGCMYGRSCDADHRIRFDAQLDELADHFGDRLVPLAMEIHREMTRTGTGAPRTFLGHMQRLRTLMCRELQSAPLVGGASAPTPLVGGASAPTPLHAVAVSFLHSIGFAKPPSIKVASTISVLSSLEAEGYTLDEIRMACDLAASMGAHGPGLIPHMVGRPATAGPAPPAAVAATMEAHGQAEQASHDRWAELSAAFDGLDVGRRNMFRIRATQSNRMLAERPPDHPLVRAAAIRLYAQDEGEPPALPGRPPLHPNGEGVGGEVHAGEPPALRGRPPLHPNGEGVGGEVHAGEPPALPGRPPLHPSGEGAGGEVHADGGVRAPEGHHA